MHCTSLWRPGAHKAEKKDSDTKSNDSCCSASSPGLSCLNRYHLSSLVKERRNYWVTGLMSLPKCLKASKWHFLSKGQGWHRLSWRVEDASNQRAQMPSLKCQSLLMPGPAWRLLWFPTICFILVSLHQYRCQGKMWQEEARLEMNVITSGRRWCRMTCGKPVSLWSLPPPTGITQLDFRLFFFFPSALSLPIWFLLLPGYSLSSALFPCIVIM